jgi:transposase
MSDEEQQAVAAGLRASDAFTLRRCQILRASARGEKAQAIADRLGCDDQTVRNAIAAFNAHGTAALTARSSRPITKTPTFDAERAARLKAVLQQSPRSFGKATSRWTLPLLAQVCVEQGITPQRVSDETIRTTLQRLDIRWKRATKWITSPDPAYPAKKNDATP